MSENGGVAGKMPRWAARVRRSFMLDERPQKRNLWLLFWVSFSSLYLEILLIRWIGTEVRIFAYFQNLALIACFLGFGLGCYRASEKKTSLFEGTALGMLVILAACPLAPWKTLLESLSSALALSPDAGIWSEQLGGTFWVSVIVVAMFLLLLVATMVPLGQWVGYYLNSAENIVAAYSLNLLGSLAGIWLFAGMSTLRLSPFYWFGFAFLSYLLLRNPSKKVDLVAALLMAIALAFLFYAAFLGRWSEWSPYQKLEIESLRDQVFNIRVNNIGYMTIANTSADYLADHPKIAEQFRESSYDSPFRFAASRDRVLIIGAGAGNDVAAALRNGAKEVDAVEIDPVIYSLGKQLHPARPYDSAHVHLIVEDGRSYLRRAKKRYDVIVFALLDSHTQFSSYSNMRVDNYVYTEQSLSEAKSLLEPTGVLVVKFEVRSPWTWMGQRLYTMFDKLFGRPPVVFYAPRIAGLLSATIFIASDDSGVWLRASQPETAKFLSENSAAFPLSMEGTPPVTDDWPYIYHRSHTIPRTYLSVSLILMAIAFLTIRRGFEPKRISAWYFFFLGAGFLLLETQLISRLALYFGSTWWVNCVALSAVLGVLVLANLVVDRVPSVPLALPYFLLVLSLVTIYFAPWDSLALASRNLGIILVAAYCVPLFLAGMIFTETLRRCENKSSAFGSNIIGAVAGGLAQNLSFIFGLKALLLIAAVFYVLAGLCTAFGLQHAGAGGRRIVSAG